MGNRVKTFGENGQIEKEVFENGESVIVKGGFVLLKPSQASDLAKEIGLNIIHLGIYQHTLMEEQTLSGFTHRQ